MPTDPARSVPLQTLNIIWLAMMSSIPIYGVVASLRPPADVPPDPDPVLITTGAFLFMALGLTVAVVLLPRFLHTAYHVQCIVRWALTETIAVLGLVLIFTGGTPVAGYGLMVCALLVMVGVGPSRRRLEEG